MIRRIVKLVLTGISWGCTVSCLISMIGVHYAGYEWFAVSRGGYSAQIIAAMISGIGWSVPSIIYDNERMPRVQQMIIHLGIGFAVYLPTAIYMKWIPTGSFAVMIGWIAFFAIGSLLVWLCFYLYYKGEAKAINRELMKQEMKNGK